MIERGMHTDSRGVKSLTFLRPLVPQYRSKPIGASASASSEQTVRKSGVSKSCTGKNFFG